MLKHEVYTSECVSCRGKHLVDIFKVASDRTHIILEVIEGGVLPTIHPKMFMCEPCCDVVWPKK